ncbi:MAG: FtsQ-type POTRA domain-containing protein [Butyrivibrio sp.]|nr:FtsQ-type POTRA domain-containing protein [Acetatifactor muris]MCM1561250.1 FtsQ-type POTRA domain-containing protein [Butyrivibrio sp.]
MFKRKKAGIIILVLVILGTAVWGAWYYVMKTYTVRQVYVEGNVHYTEEEIKEIVMDGAFGGNSLYLSLKYRNRGVENVPFVDVMDVKVLAPDTIRIIVYEKVLTGYVKFMDTYMYFDKDGYVVESSKVRTAGVPQILGLDFGYMVVGQELPVEDRSVFNNILNITGLLNKYELRADKLYFGDNGEITAYFGDVKVALGNDMNTIGDKLMLLPELLPSLQGLSGTLQMETYTESGGRYIFKPEDPGN